MSGEYRDLVLEHVGVSRETLRAEVFDALRHLAEWIKGPVTDPLPSLHPDNWHSMRCRYDSRVPTDETDMLTDHRCCKCQHCRWVARNAPIVSTWRLSNEQRPHRLYNYPFGSTAAALAATHRPDGTPLRSAMGSLGARLKEIESLGTEIQTTARHDRDPAEIRRTDLTIDVERCVVQACSRDDVRGQVSTGEAIQLVTSSAQDGYVPEAHVEQLGVSTSAVRGVVSRARKRVTVELAARDLIPEPRARVRLDVAIAERRVELA